MMTAKKNPERMGVRAGRMTRSPNESTNSDGVTDAGVEYSEILRELQRVVEGMATTVDRMQARIAQGVAR